MIENLGNQGITGIDVSAWQPHVDWQSVAAAGNRWAIIKATEGIRYSSPTWWRQVEGARAAGLLVGGYHFARWELDNPERQAEHFARMLEILLGPPQLPPVLDLEWCSTGKKDPTTGKTIYHKRPAAEIAAWAARFLRRLHELTERTPIVYTGPSFVRSYLPRIGQSGWDDTQAVAAHPLWVVDYTKGAKAPREVLPGWQWDFWQWTGSGRVPGVTNGAGRLVDCDQNWFRGSETELALFAGVT